MSDMTCVRCKATVSPQLIDFLDDGAVCRTCIIAADTDPVAMARSERALLRSIGRRQLTVGVFMLAIGIAVLALGASGGGSLMLIPTGLLLGGLVEITRGASNLSG
jgi:hypothetical protein